VATLASEEKIESLRKKIDSVDERILQLLTERVSLSKDIGKVKKKFDKPILDSGREASIYKKVEERAKQLGMNPEDCIAVFKEIIKMCRNAQENIKDHAD
jgi:chorismate mutase